MRLPAALLLVVALAACAGQGPPPRRGPPSPDAGGLPRPRLFISPAGEPFRPTPDGVEPMRVWFAQADADHDGLITLAEFIADHQRFFRLLDVNGDGFIDGIETTRYEHEIAPEILSRLDRGEAGGGYGGRRGGGPPGGGRRNGGGAHLQGPPGGGGENRGGGPPGGGRGGGMEGRTGAAQFSLLNEPEPIRAADADLDFKVSMAEWVAAARSRFAELDKDRDGRLTLTELHPPGANQSTPRKR